MFLFAKLILVWALKKKKKNYYFWWAHSSFSRTIRHHWSQIQIEPFLKSDWAIKKMLIFFCQCYNWKPYYSLCNIDIYLYRNVIECWLNQTSNIILISPNISYRHETSHLITFCNSSGRWVSRMYLGMLKDHENFDSGKMAFWESSIFLGS